MEFERNDRTTTDGTDEVLRNTKERRPRDVNVDDISWAVGKFFTSFFFLITNNCFIDINTTSNDDNGALEHKKGPR
jgi:hypothetical protein